MTKKRIFLASSSELKEAPFPWFSAAEKANNEALGIRRQLTETNPAAYLSDMAETLNNLTNLYKDSGRMDEAKLIKTEYEAIQKNLTQ